jgi:hypothetical protein
LTPFRHVPPAGADDDERAIRVVKKAALDLVDP